MRSGPSVSVFGFAWRAIAYRSNPWLGKEIAVTFGDRFRAIRQKKTRGIGDYCKTLQTTWFLSRINEIPEDFAFSSAAMFSACQKLHLSVQAGLKLKPWVNESRSRVTSPVSSPDGTARTEF